MRAIATALLVGSLTVALGACGSGDDSPTVATTTSTTAPSTTVETFGGVPGAAQEIACKQSVQTLQQASDLYTASHGEPASSVDQLPVDQSSPSVNAGYTITYDPKTGHVGATGACTIP